MSQLNFHDPGRLTPWQFYSDYEMPLARAFYEVNQRGVCVDLQRLDKLRKWLETEIEAVTTACSKLLGGRQVFAQGKKLPADSLNLSSPKQLIATLHGLGIHPPIKYGRGTPTVDEESLNELLAETGHPFIKELLRIRELNKMLGTYVNAELDGNILYSAYFVTGTVTGRRSSRENFLGLGTNGQNQPKHSDLGRRYRECLVARPGKILVACDQVSAEDWVIQGLIADISGDKRGLVDLATPGRHDRLASFIFSKPVEQCGEESTERYVAKRVRYAGSFDMGAWQFSTAIMAKEGYVVGVPFCQFVLDKFHQAEPSIRRVFHSYIKDYLNNNRTLVTPFGRRRQFFGLRDYSDNSKIFKEGYAQIPQSTVGDNTGMSVLWFETNHPGHVVMDCHDSVVLEMDDTPEAVCQGIKWLGESFDRIIRFPNGLVLTIPIKYEVGYDLEHMTKCPEKSEIGSTSISEILRQLRNHRHNIICGQPSPLLAEHSSDTSGSNTENANSIPTCTPS